jgi:hypothetical protein
MFRFPNAVGAVNRRMWDAGSSRLAGAPADGFAPPCTITLRSRPRGCKLADVFTVFVLLLMVVIAFAMGFGPQFNGPFAIAAVVFLLLGAFADIAWRRFRRR